MFSCNCFKKTFLLLRIWFSALTVTSSRTVSLTVRLVQFMSAAIGSNLLMQRQTMDLQPWLFQ
jgi:hypothetical protein